MPHLNCSVPLCVASTRRTPNLRFYRLPKEPSKRERWLRLIRNDGLVTRQTVSQWTSVCSLHFTEIPSKIIPECNEPEIFPWCPEWPDIIRAYNDEVTSNQTSIAPLPILTPENTGTNWPTLGLPTGETHASQQADSLLDVKGHGDTSMTAESPPAIHQSADNKRRKLLHTSQVNGDSTDEQSTDSDTQSNSYVDASKRNASPRTTGSLIMTVDQPSVDKPSSTYQHKDNPDHSMLSSSSASFPMCELTYSSEPSSDASIGDKTFYNPYHSPQVMSRLCELWRLGQLCDAILCVGNTVRMNAHRVVLAAVSPFVHGLCGTSHIGTLMEIKLPSGLNIEAVHKVLTYMYEGCLRISQLTVKEVWKVALVLKVDAVVGFCEEYMRLMSYQSIEEHSTAHRDRKRKYMESNVSTDPPVIGYLSKDGRTMPVLMPLKKDQIKIHASTAAVESRIMSRPLKQSSDCQNALDLAQPSHKQYEQRASSYLQKIRSLTKADSLSKREAAARNLDRILSHNTGLKKETVKFLNNSPQNSPAMITKDSCLTSANSVLSKSDHESANGLQRQDASRENSDSPALDRYHRNDGDDDTALDMSTSKEDSGDDQTNDRESSDGLTDNRQTSGNMLTHNDNDDDPCTDEHPFTAIKIKQEVLDTDDDRCIVDRQKRAESLFTEHQQDDLCTSREVSNEDQDDRCESPSLQLPSADAIQVANQLLIKLEPEDANDEEQQCNAAFPSFIVDEQAVIPDRLFASASLAASIKTATPISGGDSSSGGLVDQPRWLSTRRVPRKYKVSDSANSGYEDVLSMAPFTRGIITENLPIPDDFLNSSNPEQQRRYMASCLERQNISLIPENERQYRCSFCPAFFIKAKSCVGHVVETHNVLAKDVLNYISIARKSQPLRIPLVIGEKCDKSGYCDKCDYKVGQAPDALHYHKYVRHGTPLPAGVTMYRCTTCDKEFTTKYYWRQHLLIHEGMEQYVCETCGQGFKTSQLLRHHNSKVHEQRLGSAKSYYKECDECGKVFHHQRSYQSHVRAHEKEMLTLLSENTWHKTRNVVPGHMDSPMPEYSDKGDGDDADHDDEDTDECVNEEQNDNDADDDFGQDL